MPIRKDYAVIISHTNPSNKRDRSSVIISHITLDEEKKLDSGDHIIIKRGDLSFVISPDDLYCYGEIDFTDESEDLDTIDGFDWFNHLTFSGYHTPNDYDYESHTCISPLPFYRTRETFHPADAVQYLHGFLGKPKRTIIFRSRP